MNRKHECLPSQVIQLESIPDPTFDYSLKCSVFVVKASFVVVASSWNSKNIFEVVPNSCSEYDRFVSLVSLLNLFIDLPWMIFVYPHMECKYNETIMNIFFVMCVCKYIILNNMVWFVVIVV